MSFVIEPIVTTYQPTQTVNCALLPPQYLPYKNDSSAVFNTVAPWYQPSATENRALISTYGITNNQQYRKYMTAHAESIKQINTLGFKKTL